MEDYAFNKISTTEAFQEVLQNSENIKSLYISHFNPEVDISTFPNLLCLKLNHIDSLPKGIYELKKLKILIISNVEEVEFTKSISQLKELKYLEILFAKNINIPSGIKLLNNLKSVKINHSKVDPSFRNFVNLSNLEKLDIDFEEDKHLKGISKLKKLKMLSTNRVIPEVGDLNLEMLELDNDVHSNYPIELGKLDSLKIFKWVDNNQATIAPAFIGELKNLELVHFVRCNEFNLIPESYSNLEYIGQFKIDDCPSYTKVEHYLNEIKPMMNIHSILN